MINWDFIAVVDIKEKMSWSRKGSIIKDTCCKFKYSSLFLSSFHSSIG